jgi:lysophospholipase L1-like esterase
MNQTAPERTCSFVVTVSRPQPLALQRIVAFGDSLTEGTTSRSAYVLQLNGPDSYPFKLQRLLTARFGTEAPFVTNEGRSGEFLVDAVKGRFQQVLDIDRPDLLLLLDGANDLLNGRDKAVPIITDGLKTMIEQASGRGMIVLLATFLPQNAAGSRGAGANAVPTLNARVADLGQSEGIGVVNLFNGLGGSPDGVIGADGLHPTEEGYSRIADLWFKAVVETIEHSQLRPHSAARAASAPFEARRPRVRGAGHLVRRTPLAR